MAMLPDYLRLTDKEQAELDAVRQTARVRHEKARKAASQRGRKDFPMLPYECSGAYEEQFRKSRRFHKRTTAYGQ